MFLHRCSAYLPSHVSEDFLSIFFMIMKLLPFSVPGEASFSPCVSSGLLLFLVTCCFSGSCCQLRKCCCCLHLHSCLWVPLVTLTCLWTCWGRWEDLRNWQPPMVIDAWPTVVPRCPAQENLPPATHSHSSGPWGAAWGRDLWLSIPFFSTCWSFYLGHFLFWAVQPA